MQKKVNDKMTKNRREINVYKKKNRKCWEENNRKKLMISSSNENQPVKKDKWKYKKLY